MRKRTIFGCAVLASVGIAFAIADQVSAKYEEPDYQVRDKKGNIELRDYPGVIAARVTLPANGDETANQAFRILAGYIFGKNSSREKIPMTVPVTQKTTSEKVAMTVPVTKQEQNGKMTMTFFMPSKYSLDSLPAAKDERIEFEQIAPRRFASIRFSGFASDGSFKKHTSELQKYIIDTKLTAVGEPVHAFYNAPWTLPFMRRNEVWIEVAQPAP